MAGLADVLVRGGPVAWALLALSVLTLTVILVRSLALRGTLSGAAGRAAALARWQAGDHSARPEGNSPADRLLARAMAARAAGVPAAVIERELEWRGNSEVASLSRQIRLLELIAMISPLTGLLGTVLGMIASFRSLALAEGAANAALLADGIWVALVTTAAGLLVAIPAAVAAHLFSERVEAVAQTMESAVGQFQALSAE